MVTFTLQQVTAPCNGPAYCVTNTVTAATEASPNVYVYKTVTQAFDHYASAADMERWPDNFDQAFQANNAFYRLPSVTRTWSTVVAMNRDLRDSVFRLQRLADDLNTASGTLTINRTTLIEGS